MGLDQVNAGIILDKKIRMLDSPGVVFDDSDKDGIMLRNCLNVGSMSDPVPAVQVLLSRCKPEQLMQLYGIDTFETVIEFLGQLARMKGKLKQTGIADINGAAKLVLHDWNTGKIPSWTQPPEHKVEVISSEIVQSYSAEFSAEAAMEVQVEDPEIVDDEFGGGAMSMEDSGGATAEGDSSAAQRRQQQQQQQQQQCQLPMESSMTVSETQKQSKRKADDSKLFTPQERQLNPRLSALSALNQSMKKEKKKVQKEIRRAHRDEEKAAQAMRAKMAPSATASTPEAIMLVPSASAVAMGMSTGKGMGKGMGVGAMRGSTMEDDSDSDIDPDL